MLSCTTVTVAILASGVNLIEFPSEGEAARAIVNVSSFSISVSSKANTVVHC